MPRSRIESLSDLIFGLALSIGALSLFVTPTAGTTLDPRLVVLQDILAFFYTFVLLVVVWVRYTSVAGFLRTNDPRALRLNLALLFLVAIEPYLFNQVFGAPGIALADPFHQFVSALFALDLGGILAILAGLDHVVLHWPSNPLPAEAAELFRSQRLSQVIGAAFFLVSALPWFGTWEVLGTTARVLLWVVPLVVFGVARRGTAVRRRIARRRKGPTSQPPIVEKTREAPERPT